MKVGNCDAHQNAQEKVSPKAESASFLNNKFESGENSKLDENEQSTKSVIVNNESHSFTDVSPKHNNDASNQAARSFQFVSLSKDDINKPPSNGLNGITVPTSVPSLSSSPNKSVSNNATNSNEDDLDKVEPDEKGRSTSFVFGQNLENRVVVKPKSETKNESVNGIDEGKEETGENCDKITVKQESASTSESSSPEKNEKRKYEAITGEEGTKKNQAFVY